MPDSTQPEPTVLIAEDEDVLREAFREFLETEGFRVLCAGDGRAALDLLNTGEEVSAILLDLQMPVMNGLEFRRRQLADGRFSSTPVIAMTGGLGSDAEASQLEIRTLLRKPVTLDRLLSTLRSLPGIPESPAPRSAQVLGKRRDAKTLVPHRVARAE